MPFGLWWFLGINLSYSTPNRLTSHYRNANILLILITAKQPGKNLFFIKFLCMEACKTEIELYTINEVRKRRKALKISQRRLATELGVDFAFIGHAESPKYVEKYNLNHLNAIAVILDCSIKDFFPDTPFKSEGTKYLSL